ncbi:MAG: site-2 protease family protein [Betaproteobacteria bacterium]|jgi:Zn-dependent protease|nr:site-2 protease family protein [Betaproteobacteria bacterium]HMV20724.1 site-2 protease family protein [Rhodocyclaceae bacterium]HMW78339.1 site-2 protease family protein [Rhodocyclaceae bacterium]HNE42713.1 site-2 protease family protein [Rhodocyclaceae bacterium]HNL21805.1 site-2 protease family protein [Rhodocyclaceae bacterium]
MFASLVQTLAISALPVIFAITLHEAAHGYAARYFGDHTAWLAGRISLNPLRHIDPWGTIVIPAVILLFSGGGMLFGYAKPVPVDFGRLRNPKQSMLWVAAAGPLANLAMAFGWAFLVKLAWLLPSNPFTVPMTEMGKMGILVNCALMVLNLLPLPPLDGGRILVSLLPGRMAWKYSRIEPWGFPILLVLLFTGILGAVMSPLMSLAAFVIEGIFGLY